MFTDGKIWMAQGDDPCYLLLNQANRHGLICGASGTGKTVTLKVMAEGFSKAGVPCFLSDVKGDVSGLAVAGTDSDKIQERIKKFGIKDWSFEANPVRFWDVFGEKGTPVRVTISQMGPELLARVLDLTDAQEGVLDIVFHIADDQQLLLVDLKDLRAMLTYVGDNAAQFKTTYGAVSTNSVGTILRKLLSIADEGGDKMFGEPALDLNDWLQCAPDGKGYINLLSAVKLIQAPKLYAMFLLWLLSDLYDTLPEVGDPDKPKLVFFFDEAHLLFSDMPKALLDKIVQIVKLVRSKGVGVYFITQSPSDIPDEVLAQLSNRVEHALRAYTPAEKKAVKTAAEAFRENPKFKTADVITELGTGEALCSFLDEKGQPAVVQQALVLPPQSSFTPMDDAALAAAIQADTAMMGKYGTAVDGESAYEKLQAQAAPAAAPAAAAPAGAPVAAAPAAAPAADAQAQADAIAAAKEAEKEAKEAQKQAEAAQKAADKQKQDMEKAAMRIATNTLSSVGRSVGTQVVRGLLKNFKL